MTLAREAFAASMGTAPALVVGRAAKDPVRVPDGPEYEALMKRCFVVAAVGVNCYVLEGTYGDREVIPFGCVFEDWVRACEKLLELSLEKAVAEPEEGYAE